MKQGPLTFLISTIVTIALQAHGDADRSFKKSLQQACTTALTAQPKTEDGVRRYSVNAAAQGQPGLLKSYTEVSDQKAKSYWSDRKNIAKFRGYMSRWYNLKLKYYKWRNGTNTADEMASGYSTTLGQALAMVATAPDDATLKPLVDTLDEYSRLKDEIKKLINQGFVNYVSEQILREALKGGAPTQKNPIVITGFPIADGDTIKFNEAAESFSSKNDIKKRIKQYANLSEKNLGTMFTRGGFDSLEMKHGELYRALEIFRWIFIKAQSESTLPATLIPYLARLNSLIQDEDLEPTPLARFMMSKKLFEIERKRFEDVQSGKEDPFYQNARQILAARLGGLVSDEQIDEKMQTVGVKKVARLVDSVLKKIVTRVTSTIFTSAKYILLGSLGVSGVVGYAQWDSLSLWLDKGAEYAYDYTVDKFDWLVGYQMQVGSIASSKNYERERSEFFLKYFPDVVAYMYAPAHAEMPKAERIDEVYRLMVRIEFARKDFESEEEAKKIKEEEKAAEVENFEKHATFLMSEELRLQIRIMDYATSKDREQSDARLFIKYLQDLDKATAMTTDEIKAYEFWYRLSLPKGQAAPALSSAARSAFVAKVSWYKKEFDQLRADFPDEKRSELVYALLKKNYEAPADGDSAPSDGQSPNPGYRHNPTLPPYSQTGFR